MPYVKKVKVIAKSVKKKQPYKKSTIILAICCATLLAVCGILGVFLFVKSDEASSLNQRIKDYEGLEYNYKDLEHRFDNINERLANTKNFYDDYIVIVASDGCYHQYGCYDSITASGKFKVYTLDSAKQAGYTPCDCINPEKINSY